MKAFKTMNCLRNHKRLHVPERTYFNCDQCDKKYTQKVKNHSRSPSQSINSKFLTDSAEKAHRNSSHAKT